MSLCEKDCGLKKGRFGCADGSKEASFLAAESVQGAALPLEGIDHIHGGDGLPLGVFGVGDGVTDDVLQEHLEDTTGLLVDQARDTLDTTAASQTADGGLGDALDVVTQHLAVTLGASLSESLASLATSGHVDALSSNERMMLEGTLPSFYTDELPFSPRLVRKREHY